MIGNRCIDARYEREVFGGDEIVDLCLLPASTNAAAAMDIVNWFKRKVVVEDPVQFRDIDTSRCDVCADKQIAIVSKTRQCLTSVGFFHAAVQ